MNKLDFHLPSLTYPKDVQLDTSAPRRASIHTSLEPARRLIVLIPADSDYQAATRRIWELANAMGSRVQFLGLCRDAAQEPNLRRGLVTMSALLAQTVESNPIREIECTHIHSLWLISSKSVKTKLALSNPCVDWFHWNHCWFFLPANSNYLFITGLGTNNVVDPIGDR